MNKAKANILIPTPASSIVADSTYHCTTYTIL